MEQKINLTDIAYIAGLFDADGCVSYKKYPIKRKGAKKDYSTWNIRLEISMTDLNVVKFVHQTLMVGTFNKKPPGKGQLGKKMQYRWRCGHRDAYQVAKLIWPYAQVKLHKLEQIIDHYEPEHSGSNVVSLEAYRNE
jgi:hypothetical protein